MLTPDERNNRTWGTLIHLSALSHLFVPIPGFSIFAPWLLWLLKRHDSLFLDDQGKEAINFNISFVLLLIVLVGLFLLLMVARVMSMESGIVGIALILVLMAVSHAVLVIIAALQANSGNAFRYPLTLRLVG